MSKYWLTESLVRGILLLAAKINGTVKKENKKVLTENEKYDNIFFAAEKREERLILEN